MYRKEECLSLLRDPEGNESLENDESFERAPALKWHKVDAPTMKAVIKS